MLAVKSLHLPRPPKWFGAWLGIGTDVTTKAFTEFDEFYSGSFLPGNPMFSDSKTVGAMCTDRKASNHIPQILLRIGSSSTEEDKNSKRNRN